MTVKDAADASAWLVVIGTAAQWLPTIAALLSVIWFLIRIWEWARVAVFGKSPRRME